MWHGRCCRPSTFFLAFHGFQAHGQRNVHTWRQSPDHFLLHACKCRCVAPAIVCGSLIIYDSYHISCHLKEEYEASNDAGTNNNTGSGQSFLVRSLQWPGTNRRPALWSVCPLACWFKLCLLVGTDKAAPRGHDHCNSMVLLCYIRKKEAVTQRKGQVSCFSPQRLGIQQKERYRGW